MVDLTYTRTINPRARHLRLRVKSDGSLAVSGPKSVSEADVRAFVEHNTAWILRQRRKQQQKLITHSDTAVFIFGKEYQIESQSDFHTPPVFTVGEQVFVHGTNTLAQTKKKLDTFLKHTAERYITPRTHQLASKMNVEFKKLSYREQKSRWGSCSSRKTLSFNWRLVHYPPEIIDYVIVHELAHLTHMNHSAQFWQRVSEFDEKFQQHRRWLNLHGMTEG